MKKMGNRGSKSDLPTLVLGKFVKELEKTLVVVETLAKLLEINCYFLIK